MKFVNRHKELKRLEKVAHSDGALVVIWGRRRVGKSRLLLEWTQQHQGVYFVADESAPSIQRKYFSIALEQAFPGFSEVEYSDWKTLFLRLARDATSKKWQGPLVIDELPYLIARSPELSSVLQNFVDHEAKKARLILVLCGSSQRKMQDAILNPSAPLYGRADEIMKLSPIAIGYMQEALKLETARNVIESYAIWGGIPRYWELAEKTGGTLFEQIEQLVLDPMGQLCEEPERLLREESPSAMHLRPILDAIGMGAHRLSEIAGRIGEPSGALTRSMERLIELDLVQREIPYGVDAKNSKKSLYKIKDPFLRFWFKIVAPRKSLFSQVSTQMRYHWLREGLPSLISLMWEELCRLALPSLSENWGIPCEPAGRFWQSSGPEWDILSQSLNHDHFIIGEAKWSEKKQSTKWITQWIYKIIQELTNKGFPPVQRSPDSTLQYLLFVPEKPDRLTLPDHIRIVDAKEVIDVLH